MSPNFYRFAILCICWDTSSEKTGLWQLPRVSSGFKTKLFKLNNYFFCAESSRSSARPSARQFRWINNWSPVTQQRCPFYTFVLDSIHAQLSCISYFLSWTKKKLNVSKCFCKLFGRDKHRLDGEKFAGFVTKPGSSTELGVFKDQRTACGFYCETFFSIVRHGKPPIGFSCRAMLKSTIVIPIFKELLWAQKVA